MKMEKGDIGGRKKEMLSVEEHLWGSIYRGLSTGLRIFVELVRLTVATMDFSTFVSSGIVTGVEGE